MPFFISSCALLMAAMAVTSVQASPFSGLDVRSSSGILARDLSGKSCASFVYGAKNTVVGEVCISVAGSTLTVQYPDLSATGGKYEDLHVIVQTTSISETAPGQFPYTYGKGQCSLSGTCSIPIEDAWRACNLKLYIGIHAGFSPDGVSHETGWMEGPCIKPEKNGNCAKYFTFTTECKCPVVTKFEPVTTSVCVFCCMKSITTDISEQVVYVKTVYETHTATCTTIPAEVTAEASCDDPKVGATKTVNSTKEIAGFTCPTPA